MLPSSRCLPIRRQPGRSRRRRGLLVLVLALACSAAWAVENAAEQVNSGWAIGTPAMAIIETRPPDPELRSILHHVLEQTQVPLLRAAGPGVAHPATGSPRVAERPGVSDGWRASGIHFSPFLVTTPARTDAKPAADAAELQLGDSAIPVDSSIAVESECDGQAVDTPQPDAALDEDPSAGATGDESAAEIPAAEIPAAETPAAEESSDDRAEAEVTDQSEEESADQTGAASDGASGGTSTAAPPALVRPVEKAPPPPLTRQLMNLRARVRSVLKGYYRKPLNSRDHDCWEAMHGMLAYGINSRILQGSPRGEPITAVGWLCYNKPCKGLTLLYVTPQGELRAKWGVGLQGHSGQLLAMLAQCKVSPDYPIHVGNHQFTIHDLIEAEKTTCYPKTELTFKLLAFQQYLDLNEKWVNDQGVDWAFPRLIREEIEQPMRTAACGGTHRLSALSLTVKARLRRGEPLDGEYAEAAKFVEKHEKYAFRLQNRDGSLSTEWFRGRGDDDDIDRRIKTTGHILEWLCYSLSDEELREPQTIRAVWYLANLMYSNYDHDWEVGPRSHATHALLIYDERVFQPFDKAGDVASYRPTPSTANRSQRRR